MYDVRIERSTLRQLNRLPESVRAAALATIFGPISENAARAGKALVGEFRGMRSARRGDYRIVYEVDDNAEVVIIHRVQHRRHVYRPA